MRIRSPFDHPFYNWPATLLSFPIPDRTSIQSVVCRETGTTLPFQISTIPVRIDKAAFQKHLLLVSDLPSGAERTFEVRSAPSLASSKVVVHAVQEGTSIRIDSGVLQVRIPASQTIRGAVPGPILELAREGRWVGASTFHIEGAIISAIQTEVLEDGPVRSSHRLTYLTTTGPVYIAIVQCVAGMDFVRLEEDMEALPEKMSGNFSLAWTKLHFDYRQAPQHPYNFPNTVLPYQNYPWEMIAPAYMDNQFGVVEGVDSNGVMPFNLRLYEPWSDQLAASFANFWSDSSSDATGIFIDRPELWEDHEYALWHSSSRLAVEFVYRNSVLSFVWKLAKGRRSSCICFYDHSKDVAAMADLIAASKELKNKQGELFRTGIFPTSYALNTQNFQATLSLDTLKDWQLAYSSEARMAGALFKASPYSSAWDFYRDVMHSDFTAQLAISGVRQNHGFGPTGSRVILESWLPGYQLFRDSMTAEQRRAVEAVFLLMSYVHAGEDYMPMERMLSGHPNFLSDVKSVPGGMAFLFPEHSQAENWAEEWECYLRLNTHYHTRPEVAEWNAKGGRWTENLGTYVWAFLRPSVRVDYLLRFRDGYERFTTPELVLLGDWLVNALSAPFEGESAETLQFIANLQAHNESARRHYWGVVRPGNGPRRVHPPIGAHSERRKTPRIMWYLGSTLRNYSPLIAEHLMWAARPTDDDLEMSADAVDPYAPMYGLQDNHGTNPHLRSAKYTGYGITLRSAVDTPEELSIHLMQIDDGQNYRWGGAEGGCGTVYFYAAGKVYSHNGTEDVGDRVDQDTDFGTNFGVWKNGAYRCIGRNVLSRPLYDLSTAQFAEIVPHQGPEAYSWPEYQGRSILLAGNDYFVLYDRVFNPQISYRFSWFVRKGDPFPSITMLASASNPYTGHFTSIETEETSGHWIEGTGDSIALVTHKGDITAKPAPFGGRVHLPEGDDLVFLAVKNIDFHEKDTAFYGTAGIIRRRTDRVEVALFHGRSISAAGWSFSTNSTDLGIAATLTNNGGVSGRYFSPKVCDLSIQFPASTLGSFFLDGEKLGHPQEPGKISVQLLAGEHHWEFTAGLPVPLSPSVERTECVSRGATVHGSAVASATAYEIELSADKAKSWAMKGTAPSPVFHVDGLENGRKYHVRLTAMNGSHRSTPGSEYPLYVTSDLPPFPDGVSVQLSQGEACIRWGEVLGVSEYRLYRRIRGEKSYQRIYEGLAREWTDGSAFFFPANHPPIDAGTSHASSPSVIFEYYVTAVNRNGESQPSRVCDSDPFSWRNWVPMPGEHHRRTTLPQGSSVPNDGVGRYYPE